MPKAIIPGMGAFILLISLLVPAAVYAAVNDVLPWSGWLINNKTTAHYLGLSGMLITPTRGEILLRNQKVL